MESNPNWRKLCGASHSGSESNTFTSYGISLPTNEARTIRLKTSLGGLVGFRGWSGDVPTDLLRSNIPQNGDILSSVEVTMENVANGGPTELRVVYTDVVGMAPKDVESLLQDLEMNDTKEAATEVIFTFSLHPFDVIFNNIGCAAKFGFDQVLSVHAEDKDLDLVNYIVSEGIEERDVPLLWMSLVDTPDASVAEFLLSLGPVDMGCQYSIARLMHPPVNIVFISLQVTLELV